MKRFLLTAVIWTLACTDGPAKQLEQAQFALDGCDPLNGTTMEACERALSLVEPILSDTSLSAATPEKLQAGIIAASAQLGLAGVEPLQFAREATLIRDDEYIVFSQANNFIANLEAANGRSIDLAALNAARVVLETLLSGQTGNDMNAEAFFELGLIEFLEGFVRPNKLGKADIDTNDLGLTSVTALEAETAETNFLNADNHLIESLVGRSPSEEFEDILEAIRETYCRCSLYTDTVPGFTYEACLRDLLRCFLAVDDPDNPPPGTSLSLEQSYDENPDVNNQDCLGLNEPEGLETCRTTDTTTP